MTIGEQSGLTHQHHGGEGMITFDELLGEAVMWANSNFPLATSKSKAEHLRREALELHANPSDGEEMADVLLLLLHLADGEGIDIVTEAWRKLNKNKARQWGTPDADGVVEHLRPTGVTV